MMKKAMRFLFNIPGKSFWAILNIVLITLIYLFAAFPTAIVLWVRSRDEDSNLRQDLKDLWTQYVNDMECVFKEMIEND